MSAAECIRYIRERARTWPGAEGRLALLKMARELEGWAAKEQTARAARKPDADTLGGCKRMLTGMCALHCACGGDQ